MGRTQASSRGVRWLLSLHGLGPTLGRLPLQALLVVPSLSPGCPTLQFVAAIWLVPLGDVPQKAHFDQPGGTSRPPVAPSGLYQKVPGAPIPNERETE